MSPRTRVISLVASAAVAAAATAVVGALVTADELDAPAGLERASQPRAGTPPLALDLGVRDDPEARDLRRAARLYEADRRAEARRVFVRHDSLEARIGAAFAAWPDGSLDRLEQLGALYPRSALVQLHVGIARFWAGRAGALTALREAASVEPDTPYAVSAGDLLHPELARGLPTFLPSFGFAPAGKLSPREQLAGLAQNARRGGVRDKLLYGVALQRLGKPLSARRAFQSAVDADRNDVEALVADAVGRFDKSRPETAFARLGPLTRRFPRSASVRFHLGLLLLWTGRVDEARRQLGLARTAEPESPLAREGKRYLDRLENIGTD